MWTINVSVLKWMVARPRSSFHRGSCVNEGYGI